MAVYPVVLFPPPTLVLHWTNRKIYLGNTLIHLLSPPTRTQTQMLTAPKEIQAMRTQLILEKIFKKSQNKAHLFSLFPTQPTAATPPLNTSEHLARLPVGGNIHTSGWNNRKRKTCPYSMTPFLITLSKMAAMKFQSRLQYRWKWNSFCPRRNPSLIT